jgi:heat shock protein HslJ
MRKAAVVVSAAFAFLAGCITASGGDGDRLGDTAWRLIELQSSDDAIGTVYPDDPAKYEMRLGADGRITLRLDCNRGTGRWETSAPNRITFPPLAMTRAMCPPGSLDTRVARELSHVRSYILVGDRLRLILMADGGSQLWTRTNK